MLQVLSSVGMKAVLDELRPPSCSIAYGTAAPLKRRIEAGEHFDIAILMPAMLEDLAARGRVGRMEVLAKSFMGVGVRTGEGKPELGSTKAFKQALLHARSIAYSKEGQSGMFIAALIERLGLATELAAKTVLETRPGGSALNLAEGKAELALTVASEIVPVRGAQLAGPLPPELAHWVFFAAGIAPHADDAAVRAFVDCLRSPAAAAALQANGMEPA